MLSRWVLRQYMRVFRVSRWMRLHFTLMGKLCLIVCLVAGVYGVDTKSSTTYQLFVFVLVLLVFALLGSLFNRLRVTITRQLPRYATVGEPFIYSVTVNNSTKHNYRDLALIEQLIEHFPNNGELADFYQLADKPWYKRAVSFRHWRRYLIYQRGAYIDEQVVDFIGAQQSEQVKLSCTPLRRGKLNFSGAYIAKADLLGLFRRLYFSPQVQSCWVLPRRYPVKTLALSGKRHYQSGGVSLANSVGDSSEFMSLREYRQGDALNRIHWKSFARQGKLIVKEYQDEYFVRRALVLDSELGPLNRELFEAAVSVAASLVMSERQQDALLDLMFVGHEAHRFTAGRGVDHLPHLQEILAAVQPSGVESFAKLKQAVQAHIQQCSSLVCVLLHWDMQRQDFIQKLRAQGVPLAVFLIHDGSLIEGELKHMPEYFYLIDAQHIAEDLAAV